MSQKFPARSALLRDASRRQRRQLVDLPLSLTQMSGRMFPGSSSARRTAGLLTLFTAQVPEVLWEVSLDRSDKRASCRSGKRSRFPPLRAMRSGRVGMG